MTKLITAITGIFLAASAGAMDYTWVGDLGASWTDGANFSPAASAGGPGAGDTVTVNKTCSLTQRDEAVLDRLDCVVLSGENSIYLYAASGESVTLRCPIRSKDGTTYLGRSNTGSLTIDNAFYADGKNFEVMGNISFGPNAKSGMAASSYFFRMYNLSGASVFTSVTFTGPLGVLGSCYLPVFQTRNRTQYKFAADNVFARQDVLFQFGTTTGYTGGLDLQGHDQEIARMAFMPPKADTNPLTGTYTENHVLTSDTAATLTITKGAVNYKKSDSAFSPVSGAINICANRIEGGLSLKLAADGTGTGVFMVSNYTGFASSTTGSVSCTAGTFTFLTGANFPALSALAKDGTGNLVVQTGVTINEAVELALSGTGTLDISEQLIVAHARLADGAGGWKYLPAKLYAANDAALEGHVTGSGQILVLNGDPNVQVAYTTHTWTGAVQDGLLTTAGNWDVAPTLNSETEILRFPADADYTLMPEVDGTVTVAGIEVAYSGRFTLRKGVEGGLLNLGTKSLRFTDVTEEGGARETFYIEPDITFAAYCDHTILIDPNTKVSFYSAFTTPDTDMFSLIFDGPAVVLRGESVNCHFPMIFTNTTALTCYKAYSFGLTRAEIRAPVIPLFRNTHVCTTPWSATGAFESATWKLVYEDANTYPFEFQGAVSISGTVSTPHNGSATVFDYTSQMRLSVAGDLTFSGGLYVEHFDRLQFEYSGDNSTLTFKDKPLTRGGSQQGGSGKVDLRFYGVSTTASKLVLGDEAFTGAGYYPSRLTVVCGGDSFAGASLTPYVNSRVPGTGNLWSVLDLNGTVQELTRLVAVSEVTTTRYPKYSGSTFDVTSAVPGGTLLLNAKSNYTDTHVLRFTDQAGFETRAPWTGNVQITNAVSTTVAPLKVGSGTVTFLPDAGWAAGTNVTIGAAGKLVFTAGSRGFEPLTGTKSTVNLCLETGAQLDIAEGVTLRVATCEVNGTRLAPGYYAATAAEGTTALGEYLTGGGRLHVRSRSGLVGVHVLIR